MLFQRRDLGIAKIIHEHNITEAVHGEKWKWFFHHQHLKVFPSHHCIISGNVTCRSWIQSVAREAASGDITLPLLAGKAMLHLSTHSQQVTLACSTPKPKGARYLVHRFFLEYGMNVAMEKIRLYQTTDVQRDKYWGEERRGHPCE